MDRQDKEAIGQSPNSADELCEALRKLAPEAFSEGKVDVQALKRSLGEEQVLDGGERYRLDWAGKGDAYKLLQTPTTATLRPQREHSLNFDNAEHVFIEGENLESLKALQKAYFGKVKLIYIDPPYNTGNDSFVYPDRFQERKEDYLRRVNDLDDDGSLMREGAFRKNTKESGHYHSSWLSMMLPRLYIARNLLREDGVIFVSCDDNEFHNLKMILNEVFGEESFVGTIVWNNATDNNPTHIATEHEYIVCFARNPTALDTTWKSTASDIKDLLIRIGNELTQKYSGHELQKAYREWHRAHKNQLWPLDRYRYIDEHGIYTGSQSVHNPGREGYRYDVTHPLTGKPCKQPLMGYRFPKETMDGLLKEDKILFGEDENKIIELKVYAHEFQDKLSSIINIDGRLGAYELRDDMPTLKTSFTNPKPSRLLSQVLSFILKEDGDIGLDFFAGSGTTTKSIIDLNYRDGIQRKSIIVQEPEPLESDDARTQGLNTLSDLCRHRVTNILQSEKNELSQQGLKVFKLAPSSFKQWRGDAIASAEDLEAQIRLFADSTKDGAAVEDMLYELLLKFGQELTTPIETPEVTGTRVFSVDRGGLLFVLDGFDEGMIPPLLERGPREIIALDSLFTGNDQLKSNLELQCRDAGIRLVTV